MNYLELIHITQQLIEEMPDDEILFLQRELHDKVMALEEVHKACRQVLHLRNLKNFRAPSASTDIEPVTPEALVERLLKTGLDTKQLTNLLSSFAK